MKLFGFLLFFGISTTLAVEKARFDLYRLYEVKIENEKQLEVFKQISEYPDGYCFLSSPPNIVDSVVQFIVPPHKFAEWSELVNRFALHVALITKNLQDLFDQQENQYRRRRIFDWNNFQTLEDIHGWMRGLAASRPNDMSTFVAGISYEGREMLGLKVNIGNVTGKKSIFFEGNIHANEWIGGATTTYIMNQLFTSTDPNIQDLLNRFEWWFLPILNVDGYVYTWEVDRTWRKTRGPTSNLLCRGTDPNRNWDVYWGQSGSSSNPCTNGYHGDHVFSEAETRQLADFIGTVPNLFGYISFHSYGQLMMLPYAYTSNYSTDHSLLTDIANKANEYFSLVRGRTYSIGTINRFFGNVAGSSVDYVQINQQPKIVYCYELNLSHILPPEEIALTGQEIYLSVMTVFLEAVARGLA